MTGPRAAMRPRIRRAVPVALLLVASLVLHTGPAAGTGTASGSVVGQVRAGPLTARLVLSATTAQAGKGVRADASVTNIGQATLRSIVVELRADRTGLVIKSPIVEIAQLKPGRSTTVSWSVCGRAVGSYVLVAHVSAGADATESAGRLLEVTASSRKGSCP